ncbi:MAG: RNA polymerase sigma factor [Clostridia bacterium]|nr:RNA polymerase sigma factor [Clostridia bacterium]
MTESVFSERVRALQGPLWRIAWAILRNGADCDDAIQEALLRAWNRIGSLRDETAFDAWLMRILVNESKDILRRRARRPQTSMEAAPELTAPEENTALRDAILALPLSLRLPLLLHYMEGYSVKETARMLHLPETTVHWRLHAARKRIRDEWN